MAPRTAAVGGHAPTIPTVAPPIARQRERVARKHVTPKWVDRVLIAIAVLAVVLGLLAFLPRLWGLELRWTGTGQGSWSMARDGGVMPCSLFYVSSADTYQEGDIVSFWYLDTARPGTAEESAIKRVTSVQSNGALICRGDNAINSDRGEYVVSREKVRGKVVGPRLSLMPTAYWRWLSMNWVLQADEVASREDRVFSLATIGNTLTSDGRWRNSVELSNPPSSVYVLTSNAILVSKLDGVWLNRRSATPILVSKHATTLTKAERRGDIVAVPCERELVTVGLTDFSIRRFPNSGHVAMARWMDDTHICVRMLMTGLMGAGTTTPPKPPDLDALVCVR